MTKNPGVSKHHLLWTLLMVELGLTVCSYHMSGC
jgi:hypothetical protein